MSTRARLVRGGAVTGVGALVAAGAIGVLTAGASVAAPVVLDYSCVTPLSTETFTASFTTALPATATVGEAVALGAVSADVVAPEKIRNDLAFFYDPASLSATVAASLVVGGTNVPVDLTVPSTPMPAGGTLTLAASGTAPSWTPTAAGPVTVSAGDFTAVITVVKKDATTTPVTVTCTAPATATLGTIEVAPVVVPTTPPPTTTPPPATTTAPPTTPPVTTTTTPPATTTSAPTSTTPAPVPFELTDVDAVINEDGDLLVTANATAAGEVSVLMGACDAEDASSQDVWTIEAAGPVSKTFPIPDGAEIAVIFWGDSEEPTGHVTVLLSDDVNEQCEPVAEEPGSGGESDDPATPERPSLVQTDFRPQFAAAAQVGSSDAGFPTGPVGAGAGALLLGAATAVLARRRFAAQH